MKLYDESLVFEVFPEKLLQVRTVEDIETAKRTGKLGLIYGTQGLASIGTNMAYIWIFHSLGIKIMQLTYNESNALGSGCMEPNDGGLTRFGQQAIEAMNRLGVVLDLSHVGIRTSLEAIEHCETPPIFSHSSVRALCDHPRNLTDEQIVAVAEKGGVVGLCPHVSFVRKVKGKRPTLDDYLDHIDYIVEMVGIDHVGVGTDADFDADTFWARLEGARFGRTVPDFYEDCGPEEKHVEGFHLWSEWINVTRGLLERGYSEEDTQKVLGGNFLRVFQQVWK
jgi:membrane dipeptidase